MNKRQIMNKIFTDFENDIFTNEGLYSRELNLVFEFADWIGSPDGVDRISKDFNTDSEREINKIIAEFNRGINFVITQQKNKSYPFLF